VVDTVSTMDLAKLFNGLTKLYDLPALISSIVNVVKALSGMVNSLGGAVEGIKFLQN
jgi:hypothetical protein